MSFEDLGLSPETLKAVTDAGYQNPTPIQTQAIPVVLMGRDVLGVAQTGTGKTAAFTMPMIDILAGGRAKARMPRSLILAPTRELAAQIADNFVKYGKHHPLTMALLIGGESMGDQEKALDRGVDVLIATPGRLLDMFERGRFLLNDVKLLVIDEADRMLDMGFIPDVERIVGLLPKIRQTLFFSATMDKEIKKLADKFLMNPKEIAVAAPATAATTIKQGLVAVREADKREALRRLLRAENIHNAFIFCNRKKNVDILYKSLVKHGFNAVGLHGDMAQSKRNEMLAKFKANEAELLVCSDVAARGLDISAVGFVINFDVPVNAEDYVHRIGRTGRAGLSGAAFTLATPADAKQVAAIERLLKQPIPRLDAIVIDELAVPLHAGSGDAPAAEAAASEGEKSDKPEKGRRRRRPRSGKAKRDDAPAAQDAAAAADEQVQDQAPDLAAESAPAPEPATVGEEPQRETRDEPRRDNKRERGGRGRDRNKDRDKDREKDRDKDRDRERDKDGERGDTRRTRRNPHGIGAMEHGDDVPAFGGFTPAFMLVDPYGGKGAPKPTAESEADDVPEESDAVEE